MSAAEAADIRSAIAAFVDAVNRGDQAGAAARLTDDVTIVEDLPPFHWHGPKAASEWMLAMFHNAQSAGLAGVVMQLGDASRTEADGVYGYAIFDGMLICSGTGPALRAAGVLTFALIREDGGWLIRSFTWSGPAAAP
jgi:ketosteroid isomerase-like protein